MKKWVIEQKWSDLVFINYSIDPLLVQKRLPNGFTVDTFEGKAYLSIVPFKMSGVRFPFTPTLPFSNLLELNIRTYVTVNNKPGIYFFTLDTDHFLAAFIARTFFHLPYRSVPLRASFTDHTYNFTADHFQIEATLGESIEKDELATWLTERYILFTNSSKYSYEGQALHEPWQLRALKTQKLQQGFLESFDFEGATFESSYYALPQDVRFKPFKKIEIT